MIFSELADRTAIDIYRRNLQRTYTERLISLLPSNEQSGSLLSMFFIQTGPVLSSKNSDVYSLVKGNLRILRTEIKAAIPLISDSMTKMHLQDLNDRITQALEPK
jgi:hypothetical protein